jgi:hypothetical protein
VSDLIILPLTAGANPTIVSYNASIVKIYNASFVKSDNASFVKCSSS